MRSDQALILLVEDQEPVRTSLQRALQHCGYHVTAVADAEAAQAVINGGELDLLLTDISLTGGMDGVALAEWAREQMPNLPIMLISGILPPHLATTLGRDVLVATLSKPFGLAQLLARIAELLNTAGG